MKKSVMRVLASVLVVAMLALCLPLTAYAAYENTHVNTGDQAADIIAVAKTQIGYHEGSIGGTTNGSNNYTKYGVWYDNYFGESGFSYGAWCAMFVSWCAYQAGIPSETVYYHAYCPYGVTWWKNQGLWKAAGSYTPKAGDIIYFQSGGTASHIGIVTDCRGGYVYTVEGNTSSAEYDPEGNVCADKSYVLSNSRILGYGTPNYETKPGTTAAMLGTYKITASSLNVRAGAGTSYDIVGELENGALAVVTELNGSWGKVTLSDGTQGWCSVGDYGDYIGMDALNTDIAAAWNADKLSYTTADNGSVTFTNLDTTDNMAVDMPLPVKVGTRTTPYLNISVTFHKGGWFFGLTEANSGYFMMRECTSGDELVEAQSATMMQTDEALQINLSDWWQPADGWCIDTLRLYLAPSSSVTVNYCYFADSADVVTTTSYNMRKGGSAEVVLPDPINLKTPSTLTIPDRSKTGSYSYQNGTLTVVSGESNGYEVSFSPNVAFSPEELPYWVFNVNTDVRFDIEFLVTTADGERTFSLRDDFYYHFGENPDGDYIPAMNGSAAVNILGCYTYNDVLPADGISTIKTVTIRVGGEGTVVLEELQLAANDVLTSFTDNVTKSDSTPDVTPDPDPEKLLGDVNGDGSVTTADARLLLSHLLGSIELTEEQLGVADFNEDGDISTMDARAMLKMLLG